MKRRNRRKQLLISSVLLLFSLCFGILKMPVTSRAAETIGTAKALKFGQWVKTDSITQSGQRKYYKVTISRPGYIGLRLNSFFDSEIYLMDVDRIKYIEDRGIWGNESEPGIWSAGRWLEKGTYIICVMGYNDSTGDFWLKADYKAAGNNEKEPNQTYKNANKINLNQKIRGLFTEQDGIDYYKFTLSSARKVTIQLTNYFEFAWVEVRNNELEVIGGQGAYGIGGSEISPEIRRMDLDLEKGTYYINVSQSRDKGYYDLVVRPSTVLADNLALSRTTAVLYRGNSMVIGKYISPATATNKRVTWSTNNPYVAKVDSSGRVTAGRAGTAIITARTTDGTKLTASCKIIVKNKTLTVNRKSAVLVKGRSIRLSVKGAPAVTTKNLKFSTSNSRVATVTSAGTITARGVGKCTIYVKGNGLTRTVAVTVKAR